MHRRAILSTSAKEKDMDVLKRGAAVLGLLALSLAVPTRALHVASAQSDVVGHVYANDNTAGVNTIGAFTRHADGSLTPMAGSPFNAGGAGTGASIGSQGSLQVADDGHFLLAVDAGSNQISVLGIGPGGALFLVPGSPVSSNGNEPVSITVHRNLIYVANTGAGGSNYTGFTLDRAGQLTPLPGSTVPLPDTAMPGDILFDSTGTHLIGVEVGPSNGPSFIDSFTVGKDGRLTPATGSPFPAQAVGPFGSEFRPTNPNQLYVSNAHAGSNKGSVSAYNVGTEGALTPIGASPFPNFQTASCWVEISHDGKYLFTVNTAVPSISRYQILAGGGLALLGSTVFNDPTGLSPFDLRLDPSGRYLYVVDSGLDMVSAFAVSGGDLTELRSSPFALPAGAKPFGMVVT